MIGAAALMLGACQQVAAPIELPATQNAKIGAETIPVFASPPEGATGACWGKGTTPARLETVTEQSLVRGPKQVLGPSPDGAPTYQTLQSPAVYNTKSHQKILTPRTDFWFEVPCTAERDRAFVATLQRALKSRGLFAGSINGVMDTKTGKAVRWYQKQRGLDSTTLSLVAARQLGIIAYARPANH